VQHRIGARPGRKALNGREADALVTCDQFAWLAARREASYRKDAVLRSGKDELHAADIHVFELPTGRRMVAKGDVLSIVSTAKDKEPDAKAVPLEIRPARWCTTRPRAGSTTRGRDHAPGRTTSRSPQSIVYLNADGRDIDRIEAGEPIVVEQGKRVANGTWASTIRRSGPCRSPAPPSPFTTATGQSVRASRSPST
jgi:hypothetical protein